VKINNKTRAVVVYLGVNDAQGIWLHKSERKARKKRDKWIRWNEKGWSEVYRSRVTAFSNLLCDRGAKKVIWLTPIDVKPKKLQKRLERIRQMQKEGADASKCGTSIASSGDIRHIRQGTKLGKSIRSHDGSHMTRQGSRLIWRRISAKMLGLLGLNP